MTNVTHAELIADGGAGLVGHKGPLTGEVNQSVAAILNQEPLTLERFGGGPGKTAAENSAAWTLLAAQLSSSGGRGKVMFGGGTYQFEEALELPAASAGLEITGQGLSTRIQQTVPDEHVFALPSGAGIAHTLAIRNMQLVGPGWDEGTARTSHGFHAPSGTPDSFNLLFEDLYISDVSGDGISIGTVGFTVQARRCQFDLFGRHGINGGNNSWNLENCYAHNAKKREGEDETGAGYRFLGGQINMIGCNGLDSGDYWGIFGSNAGLGDEDYSYAQANLLACNVEAFAKVGVYCKGGTLNSLGTKYIGGPFEDLKALLIVAGDGPGIGGVLDSPTQFGLNPGGTWANGRPIHTLGNRPPFSLVCGGGDPTAGEDRLSWYGDLDSDTFTMPREHYFYGAYARWMRSSRDTRLHGLLSFVNAAGSGVDLVNAANDAAAATAGVAQFQAYRNGSQLMVRMT